MKHKASQNAKFGINFVLLWPSSYLISEHIKHSSFCDGTRDVEQSCGTILKSLTVPRAELRAIQSVNARFMRQLF